MDNNLIKIDDLVRQRLSGREEQERAGAWLRMSELLEEEMPRVRPAAFMWRRLFGGMGVVLLLAGLGVGGYEMNAHLRNGNGNGVVASSQAGPSANTAGNVNASASNTSNTPGSNGNSQAATGTISSENNYTGNNTMRHNDAPADKQSTNNNTNHSEQNVYASNTNNNNQVTPSTTAGNNAHRTSATATSSEPAATPGNTGTATGNTVAANTHRTGNNGTAPVVGANTETKPAATKAGNEVAATKAPAHTVAKTEKPAHTSNTSHERGATRHDNATAKNDNNNEHRPDRTTGASARTTTPSVARRTAHRSTSLADAHETTDNGATTGDNGTSTHTVAAKPATPAHMPLAGNAKTPAKKPVAAYTGRRSHTPAQNSSEKAPATKAETPATEHRYAGHTGSSKPAPAMTNTPAHTEGTRPVAVKDHHKTGKPGANTGTADHDNAGAPAVADNKPAPVVIPVTDKTAKEKQKMAEISAANTIKGKKVIRQMVVFQRLLRNEARENEYHMDTISIENITQEFDLASVLRLKGPKKAANGDMASNSQGEDNADATIKPASATSGNDAAGNKTTPGVKPQGKGSKAVENLLNTFNDIKYKAGNAQFAAGITGGINGTFFGPNSFKGFQFGITGKLTFGESLAVMAELKYFHRINSGYTMHDNYYNYTPTSGGFNRYLVENDYSISTLHSIELPLSVRYCVGKFNFFGGGNLVYSFAINTGDYMPDPGAPTFVTTQGNDNAGKIGSASDFNSRIGLGYLFGVSVQVSPKVTIDFRDVQTFWDNSGTPGAKYVSSQLYKSPSFQISLGYKFGGNKNKDK